MENRKLQKAANEFISFMAQAGGGSISFNGTEVKFPAKCESCGLDGGKHSCGDCGDEWTVLDDNAKVIPESDHLCDKCGYRKYKQ